MMHLWSTKAVAVSWTLRWMIIVIPSFKTSCIGDCMMNSIGIQVTGTVAPNWTITWGPGRLLPMQHLDLMWTSFILHSCSSCCSSGRHPHNNDVIMAPPWPCRIWTAMSSCVHIMSTTSGCLCSACSVLLALRAVLQPFLSITANWWMWSSSPTDRHIQPHKSRMFLMMTSWSSLKCQWCAATVTDGC